MEVVVVQVYALQGLQDDYRTYCGVVSISNNKNCSNDDRFISPQFVATCRSSDSVDLRA